MAVGRRVFLGAFTAGAVTVAAGSEASAADEPTTTFPGPVKAQKFYTDATAESAYFMTTSQTDNAATIYQAATSGGGAALNVVSDNPDTSAIYLRGTETANGTLKITHVGHANGSDARGSALSIDLKTAGSAAQGIYVIATDAPTKGALLTLRNNAGLDDFVVKGTGLIGVGIDRGGTARGQLHVVQRTKAPALFVQGVTQLADVATPPGAPEHAVSGGQLYAEAGALKWRSSNGKVTEIAPAS